MVVYIYVGGCVCVGGEAGEGVPGFTLLFDGDRKQKTQISFHVLFYE